MKFVTKHWRGLSIGALMAGVLLISARTAIDNGILLSDFDVNNKMLLHIRSDQVVPFNIPDGTITNAKIANAAAIAQSKLNLNGTIPSTWLGVTNTTAARGDLAELKGNKAHPNGYAGLDGTGRVPTAQLPAPSSASVSSVGLALPNIFTVTGSPVTTTGTLTAALANAGASSWFGNITGAPAVPVFNTTAIPSDMIQALDAGKITSGVFDPSHLPPVIGIGPTHAAGVVPDPGDTGAGSATDYLGRDALYHAPMGNGQPAYQPVIPTPVLTVLQNPGLQQIGITEALAGTSLFYSIDNGAGGFQPYSTALILDQQSTIYSYAAKVGYTNSAIASHLNPNAPPIIMVAPTFSPTGGIFATHPSIITVTIANTTADLTGNLFERYTIDGTTPTYTHGTFIAGKTGTMNIPRNSTITLKAIAGSITTGLTSSVTTAIFTNCDSTCP